MNIVEPKGGFELHFMFCICEYNYFQREQFEVYFMAQLCFKGKRTKRERENGGISY